MKGFVNILIISLLTCHTCHASTGLIGTPAIIHLDLKCLENSSGDHFAQNPKLNSESRERQPVVNWRCTAALTAIGIGIFAFDKSLNELSQKNYFHSERMDDFFRPIGRFGPAGPFVVSVPLLAGYGLINKNDHCLRTAIELTAGFAMAGAITAGMKSAAGRKRPYQSSDAYDFFHGGRSFWSGHTISAFTFATIISRRFARQNLTFIGIDHEFPLVPVLSYSFAVLAGMQRLYANDHWPSDVYFGALAGYGIGSLTIRISDKIKAGWFQAKIGSTSYLIFNYSLAF